MLDVSPKIWRMKLGTMPFSAVLVRGRFAAGRAAIIREAKPGTKPFQVRIDKVQLDMIFATRM